MKGNLKIINHMDLEPIFLKRMVQPMKGNLKMAKEVGKATSFFQMGEYMKGNLKKEKLKDMALVHIQTAQHLMENGQIINPAYLGEIYLNFLNNDDSDEKTTPTLILLGNNQES